MGSGADLFLGDPMIEDSGMIGVFVGSVGTGLLDSPCRLGEVVPGNICGLEVGLAKGVERRPRDFKGDETMGFGEIELC